MSGIDKYIVQYRLPLLFFPSNVLNQYDRMMIKQSINCVWHILSSLQKNYRFHFAQRIVFIHNLYNTVLRKLQTLNFEIR